MPAIETIKLRRGTAAAWTAANPVLSLGELGLETDTDKLKIGDGVTAWNSLPYGPGGFDASGTGAAAAAAVLSAVQNIGDLVVGSGPGTAGGVSAAEAQSFGVPIPVVVDGSAGGFMVRFGSVTVVAVPAGQFPSDDVVFPADTNGNLYQPAANDPPVIGVDPTGPVYLRSTDGTAVWNYSQGYMPVVYGRPL